MVAVLIGPRSWSRADDKEAYRTYKLVMRVMCDDVEDGPVVAATADGLPSTGEFWSIGNDVDEWAVCTHERTFTMATQNEPNDSWDIEFTFTNKPAGICQSVVTEDPLLEPMKVSGSYRRVSEEAVDDVWGMPITNSAWEQIRGPQMEFDRSLLSVRIEQNVPGLEQNKLDSFIDCVNDAPLWGYDKRCVKLSRVSWECKYKGNCEPYYTRSLEFDVDQRSFDRDILDEGSKLLNGRWAVDGAWQLVEIGGELPDRGNPNHYIRAVDRQGNPMRVILDGHGTPAEIVVRTPGYLVSLSADNMGNRLTDENFWLSVRSVSTPPGAADWDGQGGWKAGELVVWNGSLYVAARDITRDEAPEPDPGLDQEVWFFLGIAPPGGRPPNMGAYSAATDYDLGVVVTVPTEYSQPGKIHVEKYEEKNLLELGLPVELGCQFNG